jgi:hypothetical protein
MNEISTAKEQFLAELDQIRRLRKRYWLSMIALPFVGVICAIGVAFVHPWVIFPIAVPAILVRVYAMKLGVARCPRCGEFFNGDPYKPFTRRSRSIGLGLLEPGSHCANCDFPI